ncbi:MAG TPA: glutamate 5-kinase [Bdellovibrionales bacterium]|nr:glutamate 5-kinase [Bdellovibrionales bacterium]
MKAPKRIVVKLGTQIVIENGTFALARIEEIVTACHAHAEKGREFIFVSSGAVGLGRGVLGLERKVDLQEKQACAAVGQGLLMNAYRQVFGRHEWMTAQLLLTADDFSHRKRYLNLRSTMETLLKMGVAPIINENDPVSTMELQEDGRIKSFGDNDKLSALVAGKLGADLLIILTDVGGVYAENPRENPNAERIDVIDSFQKLSSIKFGSSSKLGRGGMQSKLDAARVAAICGVQTVIASGLESGTIARVLSGERAGTLVLPQSALPGRKRWIGLSSGAVGAVVVNEGAKKALVEKRASLLPSGVVATEGEFKALDVVSIVDERKIELGRGIVNFGAKDVRKILGKHSREIAKLLGETPHDTVIGRDNLVIFEEYQK